METFDYGISIEELRERFSRLYSGLIYDKLDEMNYPNQALANDIKPLKDEWVLAGPAYTIKMETTPGKDISLREFRLKNLDSLKPGMVEVRDCSNDEQAAHFGELNANIVRHRGCIGAIVDGGNRDSKFIKEIDFPVFCRYKSPVEALSRAVVTQVQVDIVLRGALTTSVIVRPWDYIFADLDGVVVIPREIVADVLRESEEEFKSEEKARNLYNQGKDPVDVYRELGKL